MYVVGTNGSGDVCADARTAPNKVFRLLTFDDLASERSEILKIS